MELTVIASGSSGNCSLLRGGGQSVLIDAGISAKRIRTALADSGLPDAGLNGIFITHEHSDHIKGLPVLLKQLPVPVYAPGAVAESLCRLLPGVQPYVREFSPETPLCLGDLTVTAFPTPHDASASVGYRLEADGACFALATDTGCVTNKMLRYLLGADAVLIEANHDETMLRQGPYPPALKRRIWANTGHLSNAECTWLTAVLTAHGTKQVIIGHLSKENNTPGLAMKTVCRGLAAADAKIMVAPEYGRLEVSIEPCFV